MHNLILTRENKEIEKLSNELGFTKTLFLERDFVLIEADSKKELIKGINKVKGKLTVYKPKTEEMLRFALEKTKINLVYGMEIINPKDSVHFVRGGLDQICCKIAKENDKIIAFSFEEILNARNREKMIARIRFNIKLCKKYKVKMFFSNFSKDKFEMRSEKDLFSLWKLLGGKNKAELNISKKVI
jgi:RNase P/RNase MRP subunit p30